MDVKLPNGVIVKNVPDDISKDDLMARAIQSNLITKEEAYPTEAPKVSTSVFEPAVPYSGAAETFRAGLQGLSFGTADEIEAAARTGQISGPQYEKLRNQLRAQQGQFGQDYPNVKTPVELAGAMLTPLGFLQKAKQASTGTQSALAGETLVGQVGRGAAVGTATGAASGYGYSTDNVGEETLKGSIFGGVLGGTVPVAIKSAGSVIRNTLSSLGIGDQQVAASKILSNYLQKDNLTPNEAMAALDELRRIGVPNATIADLGENLRGLAYSAYAVQSKAKTGTQNFLEGRIIDQKNDVVKALADKAGLDINANGYEKLNTLIEQQSDAARKAYPAAYSKEVYAKDFRQFMDRNVFKNAYKEAVALADVKGQALPPLDVLLSDRRVPTDVLHQLKIGLDRVIEGHTVNGKTDKYGQAVIQVKNEFNDLLKEKNKLYGKANEEFADSARIQRALELGQDYQKLNVKQAAAELKKFNPAEKEAFRMGMMADINNRLGDFKGGDFTRQVFKSDNQKALVNLAFENQEKYKEFSQFIKAIDEQGKTAKKVIGGSPTAERLATQQNAGEIAQIAQNAARGDLLGTTKALAGALFARGKGISSESSEALQQRLFSTNAQEQRAILDELQRRTQRRPVGMLSGSAALGTSTGILGD
jgi:RNAse (barnase) inhibitor barstar